MNPTQTGKLSVETFVVGPFPNNLYLLLDEDAGQAVVIDPSIGSEAARTRIHVLQNEGIKLAAIWNTHGHIDHVYDNALWRREFGVPISMHRGDEFFLDRLREQSLWLGLDAPEVAPPNVWLEAGQTLQVGNCACRVLETPGHSPGSVSFIFDEEKVCFAGDVLFRGSVGRTDLPGCSVEALQLSLLKLSELPEETQILPGHGETTTLGRELANNPFYGPILDSARKRA